MLRTFETSNCRRRTTLDGRWDFVTDPDDEGVERGYHESFPTGEADWLPVPCSWNVRAEYAEYFGPAWYHRTFHLPESTAVSLTLHGVGHEATVYLDGEEVASHVGGYTPISAVLDEIDAGEHDLVVRADNTLDEDTIPQPDADWFPHGGIYREVVVEEIPEVSLADLAVEYELDGDDAVVDADVTVRNLGSDPAERELSVGVGDAETTVTVDVAADTETVETASLVVEDVDRWDLDEPTLYDVTATLHDDSGATDATPSADDLHDRIGFREIAVDGREILLNGEPVTIVGVNRHEDHPDWGHAQPARIQQQDVDILERGNFNTVRCSHYPNHPRFLDLCDEAGILVIEEIPYWQFDAEGFARDGVLEDGKRRLAAMIERDRHHPSVFSWSLHNECSNHEDGMYEATAELKDTALSHDDSRLITLASVTDFWGHEEPLFELCDFLCVNAYWGWYRDDSTWAEHLDRIEERYGEKPIVASEFGAGAVPGESTFEARKWSETYQADVLEELLTLFLDRESVAGFTIWQYCDTLTTPEREMGRPRSKNNKGIVTEYRRPKDGFLAVKRLLDERL